MLASPFLLPEINVPIEHVNIPDAGRHEPKGASTAPINYVMVSNGDGTTTWKAVSQVVDPSQFRIERVVESESAAISQLPGAEDTAMQVEFGAAVNGPSDPVQMSALGLVTFNDAGLYRIKINAQVGQASGGTNASFVFLQPYLNGVAVGKSICHKVLPDTLASHAHESWFFFNALDTFTYQLSLDSAGVGTVGGLYKTTPVIAAFNDAPSASIEIDRFVPLAP